MKINLRSITVMLGLLAIVSILVPTQTQIFASTDTEPRQLDIEEVGDEDNNAEMLLMTIKEGNQKSEQVDDFQLTPDNALFVEVGKNVQVTDDENFFRAVVTDTKDKDKQIPISQQGVVNLAGLAQGAYTLDVVIQDGNRKIAYEAVLFIGPDNTQNRDTVNKEVERVNKDVTIIKKTTNIDNIVKCGKDQKFNEKTQKCVNIPPPCKPNEVRDKAGKCIPKPPTKTPTPPTDKPTPPPGQKPTTGTTDGKALPSCTTADGKPGQLGIGGLGTPICNPITPPTKTPIPPPGVAGSAGAKTPTPAPGVPPGTTVFPPGTVRADCPQFSGKQCVKLPTGLVVPVEGLVDLPGGGLGSQGPPGLTDPGGPLDPNKPVGALIPACPPGGSDVECIPGPALPGQPIAPPKGSTPIPGAGPTGPGVTRTPGDTTAPLPDLTPTPAPTPEPTGPDVGATRTPGDTTAPLPDLTPTPEPEVPGIPEPNVCDDPANAELPECQDVPPTPIIEPGRTDGTQGAPVTPPTDTEEPIPDPTPTPEPTPTTEPEEVDPVEPTEEICADPANAALPECGGPTTGEEPREDVRPMPLGEEPPIAELPTEDPGVETEPPLETPTPPAAGQDTEPFVPQSPAAEEDMLFGDDPGTGAETERDPILPPDPLASGTMDDTNPDDRAAASEAGSAAADPGTEAEQGSTERAPVAPQEGGGTTTNCDLFTDPNDPTCGVTDPVPGGGGGGPGPAPTPEPPTPDPCIADPSDPQCQPEPGDGQGSTPTPTPPPLDCEANPEDPACIDPVEPVDCEINPNDPRCPTGPIGPVEPLEQELDCEAQGLVEEDGVCVAPPQELDCEAQGMEEQDGQCVLPEPEVEDVPQEELVPQEGFDEGTGTGFDEDATENTGDEGEGGEGGDTGDGGDSNEGGDSGEGGDEGE